MRTTQKTIGSLVVVGLMVIGAGSVSAQNLNIQLDEWGNGLFNGSTPLPFLSSATDPISGQATLAYQLPFEVVRGDLLLTDTDGKDSDLLRFDDIPTTAGDVGVAYFFSDLPEPGETPVPPADTGIPPLTPVPPVIVQETGTEGNDGAIYVASGSAGTALVNGQLTPVTYNIVSDSQVPEPSTVVLLLVGALALLGYARRRRTQIV